MAGAIQNYGSFTIEAATAEKEELASQGMGGQFMRLEEGKNVVRFLPPPVGRDTPFVITFQHYINIPGVDSPLVFNCPRIMAKEQCPACRKGDTLKSSGNPEDVKQSREFWARRRVFAVVLNRQAPPPLNAEPTILAFSKTIYEALLRIRLDDDGGGDFCDPTEAGFDIIIERTGSGLNTKYAVRPARKSTPLLPDGSIEPILRQPDMSSQAHVPTWAEIGEMAQKAKEGRDDTSSDYVADAKAQPKPLQQPTAQDNIGKKEEGESYDSGEQVFDDEIPF